jgi:hypothetical protein
VLAKLADARHVPVGLGRDDLRVTVVVDDEPSTSSTTLRA